MKTMAMLLSLISLAFIPACYAEITGTIVDAETGEPIEGAVVLVEWTEEKGLPGLLYHESYKVIEVVSDKDGKVKIENGVFNPTVEPPDVTVYKKGYVAWNNKFIFPDYRKRKDFRWKDGYVFRLERFRDEYTHNAHSSFISMAIGVLEFEKKRLIHNAVRWEEIKAFEERTGIKSK